MAAAPLLPSQMGPSWRCERCGLDCYASKASQAGCAHYPIQSAAWRAKAKALHEASRSGRVGEAAADAQASGQQGLAL